ncbi:FHA domain-containing protein, partial [Micromonosporaceae bacterium Da 78-11]
VLGRGDDSTITLDDLRISRSHAQLMVDDEGLWVADLGSTNGTRVNGDPVQEWTALRLDDVVTFGPVRATVAHAAPMVPGPARHPKQAMRLLPALLLVLAGMWILFQAV